MGELAGAVAAGTPVIGLEPSCLAVFRDELTNLFPDDLDARRLREASRTLGEFLAATDYQPPRRAGRALVQVHCHQKAVLSFDAERRLLERSGLDVAVPGSGCCGMAGSFGYERGERYEVSMACGERVILPAVREAGESTLIVADGFSCREQILSGTGKEPLHLAQVLAGECSPPSRPRPKALVAGIIALEAAVAAWGARKLLKGVRHG